MKAARDDRPELAQLDVDVQREPVVGHPVPYADPDRSELANRTPDLRRTQEDPRAALHATAEDALSDGTLADDTVTPDDITPDDAGPTTTPTTGVWTVTFTETLNAGGLTLRPLGPRRGFTGVLVSPGGALRLEALP